jgi:RNA polymerase sigma-70 factor (ECF subfamily)
MVTDDGKPQPSLAFRAADGDAVALKLLLIESRRNLCERMSRRIPADLRPSLDIEDVVQEAHIDVFRRIDSFEPRGSDSFERWVAAIALNRLRSAIRKQRTLKRGGGCPGGSPTGWNLEDSTIALLDALAGPDHTPSRSVARLEAVAAVQAALAELPARYQRAVWLVHIEGRPVKVAAAEMGRSERAIHGLCRRGLGLLRNRLQSATRFLSSSG